MHNKSNLSKFCLKKKKFSFELSLVNLFSIYLLGCARVSLGHTHILAMKYVNTLTFLDFCLKKSCCHHYEKKFIIRYFW